MAKCVVCLQKKGNRLCIALTERICSACCGQKRQKEIDCPEECAYLTMGQKFTKEKEEKSLLSGKRMTDEFTDRYLDVLQNIEFAISTTARKRQDVCDRNVKEALEEALRYYNSLSKKTEYRKPLMPDNTREIYEAIVAILKWRETKTKLFVGKLSNEEIIKCLQKILGSVNFHMKSWDGLTNYLDFIEEFVR